MTEVTLILICFMLLHGKDGKILTNLKISKEDDLFKAGSWHLKGHFINFWSCTLYSGNLFQIQNNDEVSFKIDLQVCCQKILQSKVKHNNAIAFSHFTHE